MHTLVVQETLGQEGVDHGLFFFSSHFISLFPFFFTLLVRSLRREVSARRGFAWIRSGSTRSNNTLDTHDIFENRSLLPRYNPTIMPRLALYHTASGVSYYKGTPLDGWG